MRLDIRLETERLILRSWERADFDGYAELYGDEIAAKHIGGVMTRAAAWRKFLQMPGAWAVQGYAMFSIVEKATGEWLGQCGPWQPEGWPGTEVGWGFRRQVWGKGYATEAAIASIDWAFANLGWSEVIHCIDRENVASQRVAQRLGSHVRGPARLPPPYEHIEVEVWTQTRAEWFARNGART
ncbi:MAG TPA: GNAT family N-acetyltransferase [Casimicrobiaceae bacterium]|nr:GNAT family N-acetyltransferase [Casimicrobiaceae bacterium]